MQDDDDDMVFTVPEHQRRLSIDVETVGCLSAGIKFGR